jgi:hypothetical protein
LSLHIWESLSLQERDLPRILFSNVSFTFMGGEYVLPAAES